MVVDPLPLAAEIIGIAERRCRRRRASRYHAEDIAAFLRELGVSTLMGLRNLSRSTIRERWEAFRPQVAALNQTRFRRLIFGVLVAHDGTFRQHMPAAQPFFRRPPALPGLNDRRFFISPSHMDEFLQRHVQPVFTTGERDLFLTVVCLYCKQKRNDSGERGILLTHLKRLATVVRMIGDVAALRQMDGEQTLALFRDSMPPGHGIAKSRDEPVYSMLCVAKRHPTVDVDGSFSSHLRSVPHWFMHQHPALWHFPSSLATTLLRHVDADVDRTHLVLFADHFRRVRIDAAPPGRLAERVAAAVAQDVNKLIAAMAYWRHVHDAVSHWRSHRPSGERRRSSEPPPPPPPSFCDMLPRAATLEHLLRLAAVASIRYLNLTPPSRRRKRVDNNLQSGTLGEVVTFWKSVVKHGVFEDGNLAPAAAACVTLRAVRQTMRRLAEEDPDQWGYQHLQHRHMHPLTQFKDQITDEEVDRLVAAVGGLPLLHQVVLLLLSHVGLRAGAIARMVLADVYDPENGVMRQRWSVRWFSSGENQCPVMEKFSKRRCFCPTKSLCASMRMFLASEEHCPHGRYLFSTFSAPLRPHRNVARNVLRALCQKAHLRPIHPHQFRAYVVKVRMAHGSTLEQVSKWLGHRNIQTTYLHYLPNSGESPFNDDEPQAQPTTMAPSAEIESLQNEISRLKRLLSPQQLQQALIRRVVFMWFLSGHKKKVKTVKI